MKIKNSFTVLFFTGWMLTSISILLIATLIISENSQTISFWIDVAWTEFLSFLFWGGFLSYVLTSHKQNDSTIRFGGIAPTVSMAVAFYSLISFLAMIFYYYLPDEKTLNRWYLIFQILLFTGTALTLVLLLISRSGATTGLYFDYSKAETPKNLHDLIAAHESILPNTPALSNIRSALKNLRESLLFSLNETSQLSGQKEYQDLCNDIKILCNSLSSLPIKSDVDGEINRLDEQVIFLSKKLGIIIAKQVQR